MNNNKIKINAVSNYLSKIWALVSIYIFIPIYISLLGVESYGLIAFQTAVFSFIFIADAGFSSAFSRECARINSKMKLKKLMFILEKAIALLLGLVLSLLYLNAEWLSINWLSYDSSIELSTVTQCIKIMCLGMLPQILMSLYFGGLMGLERQVKANILHIGYSFVRSGLVIVPLFFYQDIELYFYWYFATSMIFCLIFRFSLIQELKNEEPEKKLGFVVGIKEVLPFASGMLFLSLLSATNNQVDKLFVSAKFTLSEFSIYNLASVLGQTPFLITLPIAIAILPRLTKLISNGELTENSTLYTQTSILVNSLGCIVFLNGYLYLPQLLELWLGSTYSTGIMIQLVPILLLGSLFLSFQLMPFQLSLANGHNKTSVKLGLINLVIYIPTMIICEAQWGMIGVTIPWFVINFINFVVLSYVLNKRYYDQGYLKWLGKCCFLPATIVFLITFIGYFIQKHLNIESLVLKLILATVFAFISSIVILFLLRKRTVINAR